LICLFLSTLFQNKCEDNKKNFLYIHGKTNTGKSTYLTKVLTRYYGIDNVGNIVNSTNFKFQDLYEKLLVIMDEFRYSSGSSSDFLKLLGGEPLLTTQKYSKNHILINKVMGVILSNYLFHEKNDSVQKALMERLFVVEFLNSVNKDLVNINEVLQDEEPSIIIFCNKVYFSCKVRKINFKLDQKELIKK
jgi:phage/plasmid-associated DNA primase